MDTPPQDAAQDNTVLEKLIDKAAELDKEVEALESIIKATKEQRKTLAERTIPDVMRGMNMSAFTSTNGYAVKLTETHFGKIEDKTAANNWLKESGNGDVIKREVKVMLSYDEDDKSCALLKELTDRGLNPSFKESVNHQTLNKLVRECIDEGIELPKSIKVSTINEAKIKHVV